MKNVEGILDRLLKAGLDGGRISLEIEGKQVQVGTLVIDSIDAIQRAVQSFEILKGRTKMEMQDWGRLLERMQPLMLKWSTLPVHVVVVSHVKRRETTENSQQKVQDATLAVRGALREEMPRWFSTILHIVSGGDGKRYVIAQPMIHKGTRYLAKDRHNHFLGVAEKGVINLPADEEGYPGPEIARTICNGRAE
jgi:hypothetical protein